MDRSMEMKEGSIGSLLWSFSLPAIIGMSVNALYNIVGRIFVGRGIGALAIAATTVAFPLMIIIMAVSILVGVGATALISIRLGEDKKEAAEKIAANAITMIILLSAIFAALFFVFTEQVLTICGASPEVMPYARDYTQIIMLGAVFGSFSMGVNNFIRAEGNPKVAMYTQLLGQPPILLSTISLYSPWDGESRGRFSHHIGPVAFLSLGLEVIILGEKPG